MKLKITTAFITIFLFLAISASVLPMISYGKQGSDNGDSSNESNLTLENPLGDKINNLPSFVYNILGIVFQIGAVLSVLVLIYVGFMFVTARGDTEKLQTARRAFLYTVIGIAVFLGARLIASIISSTISDVSTGIY